MVLSPFEALPALMVPSFHARHRHTYASNTTSGTPTLSALACHPSAGGQRAPGRAVREQDRAFHRTPSPAHRLELQTPETPKGPETPGPGPEHVGRAVVSQLRGPRTSHWRRRESLTHAPRGGRAQPRGWGRGHVGSAGSAYRTEKAWRRGGLQNWGPPSMLRHAVPSASNDPSQRAT